MQQLASVPAWLFLAVLGALGTIVWFAIRMFVVALREHAKEDVETRERVAVLESEMKGVKAEIGDRKSGIRGWLHELANELTPRSIRRQLEDRDK